MPKDLALNNSSSKIITSVLVGGYFIHCLTDSSWHVVDGLDLIIHEAGHPIMRIFGEFISILGGSLFQVLIPLIFIIYFLRRGDFFSGSLLGVWLGYNFINISVYIKDSIVMQLDLLGGDNVIHDWNYLLSHTGLLKQTYTIAYAVHSIGIMCIIIGLVLGFYFAFERKNVQLT